MHKRKKESCVLTAVQNPNLKTCGKIITISDENLCPDCVFYFVKDGKQIEHNKLK